MLVCRYRTCPKLRRRASVIRANPLGEQSVDFQPQRGGTSPPLASGATVPVAAVGTPPNVGEVINIVDRLFNAIPKQDLTTAVHELAGTLAGRGQDLRTLTQANLAFSQEFLNYQAQFKALRAYSPYHNLKKACYPPTLITTGDHDDRVYPAHSFKFAAAAQAAQTCDNPVLIRIETRAGHGAGKPTWMRIEEIADQWAFLVKVLALEPGGLKGTTGTPAAR